MTPAFSVPVLAEDSAFVASVVPPAPSAASRSSEVWLLPSVVSQAFGVSPLREEWCSSRAWLWVSQEPPPFLKVGSALRRYWRASRSNLRMLPALALRLSAAGRGSQMLIACGCRLRRALVSAEQTLVAHVAVAVPDALVGLAEQSYRQGLRCSLRD